eukprot:CAMPEP_0180299020 /NCGR_PEP_ID=MMETSP0988-20121125/21792_1 /TAXON_ID=697907 /ORGANISM="non described non described, Strain CCMP2293" /LENGTH=38 /DNA_ID= /DNA_START= /DNA_END= /DNA_ORIENTATION=
MSRARLREVVLWVSGGVLITLRLLLGPYSRPVPRALWW